MMWTWIAIAGLAAAVLYLWATVVVMLKGQGVVLDILRRMNGMEHIEKAKEG